MAGRGALRHFNKVMDRCPHCGGRKPKELAEGEKEFLALPYVVLGVLTCGLGFLLFPLFFRRGVVAYCGECGATFAPR